MAKKESSTKYTNGLFALAVANGGVFRLRDLVPNTSAYLLAWGNLIELGVIRVLDNKTRRAVLTLRGRVYGAAGRVPRMVHPPGSRSTDMASRETPTTAGVYASDGEFRRHLYSRFRR